jgi:hypothetical protein
MRSNFMRSDFMRSDFMRYSEKIIKSSYDQTVEILMSDQ